MFLLEFREESEEIVFYAEVTNTGLTPAKSLSVFTSTGGGSKRHPKM